MRVALYLHKADGFGEWRILLGTSGARKLREFRKRDIKKFKTIYKKIKELSNGQFSGDNQNRLDGTRSGVPIFEAYMERDLRLVYQIDCVPDHDGAIERQVIRIYGIYARTQRDGIWDAMSHHLADKGKEYTQRCTPRNPPIHPGEQVYLPAVFPPQVQDVVIKPPSLVLDDQEMDQLHSLLVLDKYVTFSQALLNGLIAKNDVQHVFELTTQQREIVECTTSCYVLGRSGTGKTTTMLFKMLGIQQAWQLHFEGSDIPRPRQIFVTTSHVLANKVENYFIKLMNSLSQAGCTLDELARLQSRHADPVLVDSENVSDTLPQRYSELEDHHFPLFLPFERLTRMIAADMSDADYPGAKHMTKLFMHSNDQEVLDSFVSYEVFVNNYWPHFPPYLTKGRDPWLVFGEIVGTIEGSEKTLGFYDRTLDKNTYCNLPPRSNPTFSSQRHFIYAIYEAYSKLKHQRGQHDAADRTHAILKTLLGSTPFQGRQVDFLYVDEAQDSLLIDALLLRLLCSNPEGLFWAGDTAQTISPGSSFRFDDLRAFLHRIEMDQASSSHIVKEQAVAHPASFQLAINHRSHGGILNCARSVIELISHFWPHSIDSLQPEHGTVDGVKPVFCTGWDKDTSYEHFLVTASSHNGFGVRQCILVRDEEAKEKLEKQLGAIGMIMTLYESKGLEFDDVLLYNFFEDSNVDLSRWRLVLAAIDTAVEGHNLRYQQASRFERDTSRYAAVCSELKFLYVGITRARKRLWIVDNSDKAEPMKLFWTSRSQIQTCTPDSGVPQIAVSSIPEEWAESGHSLFQLKRYMQAMHCFRRANMPREVRIAEAYHFRELARATIGVALPSEQQRAFAKAADAFVTCGSEASGREKLQYYRTAAECYVRAADGHKVADAYLNAEEYELAANYYRKAGLWDKTVNVLASHSEEVSRACADQLLTECRLYYCSKIDEKPPSPLFISFEEEVEFLETCGLDVALAALYESHGKYHEAAELLLSEDKPLYAIGDFLKDKTDPHAVRRAADVLLECLWKHCSFGVARWELHNGIPKSLISLSHQLPLDPLSPRTREGIKMFQTAAADELDRRTLEVLAETFEEQNESAAALWCLNHVFSPLPQLLSATLQEFTFFLRKFYIYSHLLYTVACHSDPVGVHGIRRLFGITRLSDDQYVVQPGSFILMTPSTKSTTEGVDERTNPSSYSHGQITDALKERVRSYLRLQVNVEIRLCHNSKILSQCLLYAIYGSCNYAKCKQQHDPLSSLDSTQYNARIGLHLQQMRILQLVYSAFPEMREWKTIKGGIADWIAHLYEAFFPPFRAQGSLANLDWSSIEGAHDGIRVTRNWVRGAIYSLDARKSTGFLTDILRLIKLSSIFGEGDALQRANCVRHYPPKTLLRNGDRYIVKDMIDSVQSSAERSISAGMLGLHHVICNDLQVNLSVLCDCIEEVLSTYVITLRLKNKPGADSLHDAVLPRSWLIRTNKPDARKDVGMIDYLLDGIKYLLVKLRSDNTEGSLWLMHTDVTPAHRSVFIARICRMLCLASYNCPPYCVDLKAKVSDIMSGLRSNDTHTTGLASSIYGEYAEAAYGDYLRVIVAYDENHVIPNLVHLVCEGTKLETSNFAAEWRIERLSYSQLDEIPARLASPLIAVRSSLLVEAPLADDNLAVPNIAATDEEESAARLIQRVYRQHCRKQKRQLKRSTLEAERSAIFVACLKHAQASAFPRGFYRLLYLGPLPHLLLALKKGISIATCVKARIKIPGLLLREGYERLQELGRQRSEISSTLKQGQELLKTLSPGSQFHKNRDIAALKDAVLQVKEFLRRIPGGTRGAPEELNIAYKAIVTESTFPNRNRPSGLSVQNLFTLGY
ncbi:hypothetical protein PISMIDRAFT_178561 [Pisolithus microcarpus 441]|uniref:UvrD-like helicase ATP-binding domain-containing protein n=1 Tax=Pisolithus microcarpus 441 TaxID=765257 RepID=A0A0C9Z8B6_9AGAM|nr:hypothetical protein PISMIDRAFT_178561 [Pisolithus microcarpus 441]